MTNALMKKFTFEGQPLVPQSNNKGKGYIIEAGLYEAVRLALLLNQPLLLTGKPGTGKTELAHKIAHDLCQDRLQEYLPVPLVFNTKTTSTYTDLFYSYDALGHFRASNFSKANEEVNVTQFIQLQALGQAIVLSNQKKDRPHGYKPMNHIDPLWMESSAEFSSVVLIDEVDKAPRDFANDLLYEMDNFEFSVKEHQNNSYKTGRGKILLILTSNSEKNLPDAFLRRCLFYHIGFPGPDLLKEIVLGKLFPEIENGSQNFDQEFTMRALDSYLVYFSELRSMNLKKEPATAELISWIIYLKHYVSDGIHWSKVNMDARVASLSILAKHSEDYLMLKNGLTKNG